MTQLHTAATLGVDAHVIDVETHVDSQLYSFNIVGLPDSAVRESRERIIAAIKNSGRFVPGKRYTVNLAPADIRKEGSAYDLPIALGLLAATDQVDLTGFERTAFLGELALDGTIRPCRGSLPIALHLQEAGFTRLLLPRQNAAEAGLVERLEVVPVASLSETIGYLENQASIEPISVDRDELFRTDATSRLDLHDVKGQENVKRALEVSAAGGHNLIMVGPPGSGKTMVAKRLPTLLPPMTFDEAIETTKIHSVAGQMNGSGQVITQRPYRSPHHTISDAALVGGGMGVARPGEISLAHHGVLFLDELPEFARNVLEVLRQPLEENEITISRTKLTVTFPCNFQLVASMNPCPCGNYGNPNATCSCSPVQIQRYMSRISGPLLDRIDIHVEVGAVNYKELSSDRRGDSSADVQKRVVGAREVQAARFAAVDGVYKNADMSSSELRRFCPLDETTRELMTMALTRLGLSARAYDKILKVGRTIADLAGKERIAPEHLSEAIQYRSLDRQFWNA